MSSTLKQTTESDSEDDVGAARAPGLLLVFSAKAPVWAALPLRDGELELGRDSLASHVRDGRISRRHARVFMKDGQLHATDLGSLNGTAVDGRTVAANQPVPLERCLRIGDTLFLPCADLSFIRDGGPVSQNGRILGPRLWRVYLSVARLARTTPTLHITGESGVGKEDAARSFHTASAKKNGPFIAVNCATIPEGIAERLLFGARRGSFSGADADAQGYVQAADGGTLFLDEIAELNPAVQAKLLRVLETREVQAVGAVRATAVDVRVCSASHASLREQVASGKMREDLYYRIGRPEISIPPLRERPEEIPWLVEGALRQIEGAPLPHFSFIEACLLRPWPGNIRELLVEVRAAAQEALAEESARLDVKYLPPTAGQSIKPPPVASRAADHPPVLPSIPPPSALRSADELQRAEIEEYLRKTGGNVSKAARALGIHRNALRRLIVRHEIDLSRLPGIISEQLKEDEE